MWLVYIKQVPFIRCRHRRRAGHISNTARTRCKFTILDNRHLNVIIHRSWARSYLSWARSRLIRMSGVSWACSHRFRKCNFRTRVLQCCTWENKPIRNSWGLKKKTAAKCIWKMVRACAVDWRELNLTVKRRNFRGHVATTSTSLWCKVDMLFPKFCRWWWFRLVTNYWSNMQCKTTKIWNWRKLRIQSPLMA